MTRLAIRFAVTSAEKMNRRFDIIQAENQRQHDVMQQVLRVYEGRITHLEEKAGISPADPAHCGLAI